MQMTINKFMTNYKEIKFWILEGFRHRNQIGTKKHLNEICRFIASKLTDDDWFVFGTARSEPTLHKTSYGLCQLAIFFKVTNTKRDERGQCGTVFENDQNIRPQCVQIPLTEWCSSYALSPFCEAPKMIKPFAH